uniref:Uncharacterized protein n=1 Tax=Arundo donax TaxID=35708 RepID=A0A0A9H4N8_ARUDO
MATFRRRVAVGLLLFRRRVAVVPFAHYGIFFIEAGSMPFPHYRGTHGRRSGWRATAGSQEQCGDGSASRPAEEVEYHLVLCQIEPILKDPWQRRLLEPEIHPGSSGPPSSRSPSRPHRWRRIRRRSK